MVNAFLIPEQTIEAKGVGPEFELGESAGKRFLLTLSITRVIEQESLDVSIWGSEDKTNWGQKAITAFSQKFYAGENEILVDLSELPNVKYLRGQWDVARWGRGRPAPRFTFAVRIRVLAGEAAA